MRPVQALDGSIFSEKERRIRAHLASLKSTVSAILPLVLMDLPLSIILEWPPCRILECSPSSGKRLLCWRAHAVQTGTNTGEPIFSRGLKR